MPSNFWEFILQLGRRLGKFRRVNGGTVKSMELHIANWFQKQLTDFRECAVQKFRLFHEKVIKFSRISREFSQNCFFDIVLI